MGETKKKKPTGNLFRRFVKRLIKGIAVFVLSIAIGLIAIVLGVLIFIKFGDVKPVAQSAISYFSGGEASIESLTIDLDGRIEAKSFHLKMPDGSLYDIKNISLTGHFLSALSGKLEIESLIIDEPGLTIISNGEEERIEEESDLPALFPIPVSIKSFVVKNLSVTLQSKERRISMGGLQVLSRSDVGFDGAYSEIFLATDNSSAMSIIGSDVKAEIEPRIKIKAEFRKDGRWSLNGDLQFNLKNLKGPYLVRPGKALIDIEIEGSYLKRFTGHAKANVSFFDDSKARIDANWEEKDDGMLYAITSESMKIDLTRLTAMLGEKDIRFTGLADIDTFKAEGFIPDKAESDARHKLSLKGELTFSDFVAGKIKASNGGVMELSLTNLEILGEKVSGSFAAKLNYPEMTIGKTSIENGTLSISADFTETIDKKTFKKVNTIPGEGVVDLFLKAGKIEEDSLIFENVMIGAKAIGDVFEGEFRKVDGKASVAGKLSLKLQGSMKKFGKEDLLLKTDIHISDLLWLKSFINDNSSINPTSGDLKGTIKLIGMMGDEWANPSLNVYINSELKGFAAGYEKEKIKLENSDIKLIAKGEIGQAENMTGIEASLEMKSKGLIIRDNLSLRALTVSATITSPDFNKNETNFTVRFDVKKMSAGNMGNGSRSAPASLEIEGAIDPKSGRRILKSADLKLGQTGELRVEGWVDDAAEKFKVAIKAEKLDLSFLESFVMANDSGAFPITGWGGLVTASLSGEGTIPKSIGELKKSIPLALSSTIELTNGKFKIEKEELNAEGVDLDLKVEITKSMITTAGGLWIGNLESEKLFGAVSLDPTLEFDLSIEALDRLIVDRFVLDTPALGFVQALDGSIQGLKLASIFDNKENYKKIIPDLTANLNSYFSFVLDERQKLLIDMDITGDVTVDASLTLDPKMGLRLQGDSQFQNFSIRKGEVKYVENLNGSAPFIKTLAHAKQDKPQNNGSVATPQKIKSVRETTFFDDLRETGSSRESFVVKLIEVGPINLNNTMFDLNLEESRLGIDYLRTNLLGGGLTGSFHIKSEEGVYVLRTTGGFAGLDLQRMIENDLGLTDDEAKVDGSVTIELKFRSDDEVKELDINSVNFSAYLTTIGSKALDRLLKFFDPQESSPSVMNARTLLKYATPKRVELIARNGNLSLTIDQKYSPLLGGLEVTMPVIKRAPIHGLVNFEVIKSRLKKLSALKTVMRIVGATQFEITESGEIILR